MLVKGKCLGTWAEMASCLPCLDETAIDHVAQHKLMEVVVVEIAPIERFGPAIAGTAKGKSKRSLRTR